MAPMSADAMSTAGGVDSLGTVRPSEAGRGDRLETGRMSGGRIGGRHVGQVADLPEDVAQLGEPDAVFIEELR